MTNHQKEVQKVKDRLLTLNFQLQRINEQMDSLALRRSKVHDKIADTEEKLTKLTELDNPER